MNIKWVLWLSLLSLTTNYQVNNLIVLANDLVLSPSKITKIAEKITVRIEEIEENFRGSGVIIKKQTIEQNEKIYTVLTNCHVVNNISKYKIITADQKIHLVQTNANSCLYPLDLAVLNFRSNQDYQVAEFANPEKNEDIYVYGWINIYADTEQQPKFISPLKKGNITQIQKEWSEGYHLIHTAFYQNGMSGGAILNNQGKLLGINTRFDYLDYGKPQHYGIPIYLYQDPNLFRQLFPIKIDGKIGYINISGEQVIAPQYNEIGKFSEGLNKVKIDNKWGYINRKGKQVVFPQYQKAKDFSQGLALIKINDKWGYLNREGKIIITPKYQEASNFQEELASVKVEGKWGYINKQGEFIIEPLFEEASNFQEELASVKVKGKWGYINKQGEFIAFAQYQKANDFHQGLASVKVDGKWGYINKQGKLIIAAIYEEARNFSEGLAPIKFNGKWGYLNSQGELVTWFKYKSSNNFNHGLVPVKLESNGKWGYLNQEGKLIIAAVFDQISEFENGFAWVKFNGKTQYINKQGKFLFLVDLDFLPR